MTGAPEVIARQSRAAAVPVEISTFYFPREDLALPLGQPGDDGADGDEDSGLPVAVAAVVVDRVHAAADHGQGVHQAPERDGRRLCIEQLTA